MMMDGGMMCGGGMAIGGLFVLLLFAVIAYVAYRFGRSRPEGPTRSDTSSAGGDEALDLVRARYARGEISREEYEQVRRDLA